MRYLICFAFIIISLAGSGGADPIVVGGVVTFADGTPVEDAGVEIMALPGNFAVAASLLEEEDPASNAVDSTVTDAEGRFLLKVPGVGVWRVRVRAEGFVAMEYAPLPLAQGTDLPPVALFPAEAVEVLLLDSEGRPAAGVPVQLIQARRDFWRQRAWHGWRPALRFGRSDAGGRLVVNRAPEEELELYLMPAGRLPMERRITAEEAVTWRLPPPPTHRRVLQVTDSDGEPAAGVVVMAGGLGWPLGRTDAQGRLEIALEESGEVPLRLVTEPQVHGITVSAPSAAESVVRVSLPSLRHLRGRVVDARGDRPLVGALVWCGRDAGAFAVTDGEGRFSLTTSAEGRFWVQAEAAGFLPRLHRLEAAAGEAGKDSAALRIALERAARIEGRVVDGKGRPLAGVQLAANARFREQSPTFRLDGAEERTRSDQEGRFTLVSLVTRGVYEVTAAKVGYQQSRFPLDLREARDGVWTLVLEPARSASGKVVDGEERPLAGVRVTVAASPEREGRRAAEPVMATTDAEGVFRLPELPPAPVGKPGMVDLEARREGFIPLRVRRVVLPEGQGPVSLGTLILTPGTAVRGRVTDSAGKALAEVSVWLRPDTGQSLASIEALHREDPTTVTDAEGRFRIEDLPLKEKVHLLVTHEGYLSATRLGLQLPLEEELRIPLERGAQVRGRVVGQGGEALAEARVRLHGGESPEGVVGVRRQAAEGDHVVYTDPDGAFQITGVTPGRVTLDALAAGYQPSEPLELDLPPAGVVEGVELVLAPGATLEGRVTNTRGEPVAEARLSMDRQAAATDEAGFYRLEGLPPGLGIVTVRHRAYQRQEREVEIALGTPHTVDFVLVGGWSVAGRVLDAEGEPVPGVLVEMQHGDPRDQRRYRGVTDPEGRFAVEGVVSGSYDLEASREGYAPVRQEAAVVVEEAAVRGVEIRLQPGATLSGRILGLDFEELAVVQVEARQGETIQVGTVDYAGGYTIEDLGPGGWLVKARLRGGSREAQARVVFEAGDRRREKDLEFDLGLTLSGRVVYGDSGLVGARVTLTGGEVAVERSVITDQEGRFRLEDLSPGSYRLTVNHARELITHTEDITFTAERDLEIVLATALLRGRVVSAAEGEPVGEAQIRLQRLLGPDGSQPGPVVQVDTDPAGTFLLARVAVGRHRLSVLKSGYAPVERPLELGEGEERTVEIPLTSTEGLEMVVTLTSGERPPYAAVVLAEASGQVVVSESSPLEEDGVARFTTLPPGTWELLVAAPGSALTRLTTTVPGRQEVVLPRAARLRVRVPLLEESDQRATLTVFGPDGRPVQALDAEGALRQQWTVEGGTATVGGLPPGVWTLRIVAADGQLWQATAATAEGVEAEIRVE